MGERLEEERRRKDRGEEMERERNKPRAREGGGGPSVTGAGTATVNEITGDDVSSNLGQKSQCPSILTLTGFLAYEASRHCHISHTYVYSIAELWTNDSDPEEE